MNNRIHEVGIGHAESIAVNLVYNPSLQKDNPFFFKKYKKIPNTKYQNPDMIEWN